MRIKVLTQANVVQLKSAGLRVIEAQYTLGMTIDDESRWARVEIALVWPSQREA